MIVGSRQTIFDVALQHSGTVEAAFDIALENDVSLTDDLQTGVELATARVQAPNVVKQYKANNIVPATGQTTAEINDVLGIGEGIEFWGIEYDFIVS